MAKKLDKDEIYKRFKDLHNGEYALISEYISSSKPITIKHICGYQYTIKQAKLFLKENGGICPKCNKNHSHSTKRYSEEDIKEKIESETNGEYSYISGFINTNSKIKVKHNTCGNIYETTAHLFLGKRKRRCPICANKNRGKYALKQNYLDSLLNEKEYGNEYTWLEDYKNNNKLKHKIRHNICGTIYEVKPNDFQQGYQCPHCMTHKSKYEIELYNFIKSIYNNEIIENYRINSTGMEIDIYIPDLKLGFEFNGTYWHSIKIKSDINYHLTKQKFFKEHDITLYYIEEIDWINKQDIIKSKIKHLLKLDNDKKIFARKCEITFDISNDEKKCFLNTYHIQGNAIDSFRIGLKYNNELVALMTFAINRKNLNSINRIELLRYATKYNIVGGFSKLLKHSEDYIKNHYEYSKIYTYADLSLSSGNVYYKNGFNLDHVSKPSYFFVYKNKKYNRYSFRKSELKRKFPDLYDDKLTESQITDKIKGLYKIYNCGNLVFTKDIN